MADAKAGAKAEERDGVRLTNLDQPLFRDAGTTKRDLVDYLDAVRDRLLPALRGRPLSVVRVLRGQDAFMQKNVPKYTPDFVRTVDIWAEASKRQVSYALCEDRRTLLWFGNQRAIEYHVPLSRAGDPDEETDAERAAPSGDVRDGAFLVLDLDPPSSDGEDRAREDADQQRKAAHRSAPVGGAVTAQAFGQAARAALLVKAVLDDLGLAAAVKTSGAKGVHVFVPLDPAAAVEDAFAATRAIAARAEKLDPDLATTAFVRADRGGKVYLDPTRAGGATVIAPYSPRVRPGVPVSFPVAWADLTEVSPADFTVRNAAALLGDGDPWADALPPPQRLPADLVAEGHEIPSPRVVAMHEGKRRKRAAASED